MEDELGGRGWDVRTKRCEARLLANVRRCELEMKRRKGYWRVWGKRRTGLGDGVPRKSGGPQRRRAEGGGRVRNRGGT